MLQRESNCLGSDHSLGVCHNYIPVLRGVTRACYLGSSLHYGPVEGTNSSWYTPTAPPSEKGNMTGHLQQTGMLES